MTLKIFCDRCGGVVIEECTLMLQDFDLCKKCLKEYVKMLNKFIAGEVRTM